jgi:enhancing lycopene biosynthesis protein 2
MVKVAVVLSGCGHKDGAEIREAVLSLLSLDRQGAQVSLFAPDTLQAEVIDHLTGTEVPERRNILSEAARIARGDVKPLAQARADDFDALVLPGGFGAAKNLSDFASKGAKCKVLPDLERLIRDFHAQQKPIGAICISPAVLVAALRGKAKPVVTIGDDTGVAGAIEAMGGRHKNCPTQDCVADAENRVVTTPAYMRDDRLSRIAEGIDKLVAEVVRMAGAQKQKAA